MLEREAPLPVEAVHLVEVAGGPVGGMCQGDCERFDPVRQTVLLARLEDESARVAPGNVHR